MWAHTLQGITNLFLQHPCPLCDRPAPQDFCPTCWHQLQSCFDHQPAVSMAEALPVLALGPYQHPLKQAIAALKYEGYRHLAIPLGQSLGKRWHTFPITTRKPPLVVPIPLHPEKLRERGFNQAELLAAAFCDQTGLRIVRRGLVRQKATAPQFGLGVEERQKNLTSAFDLGPAFLRRPHGPVLLLDDIYTTGTTARTAAATIRNRGVSVCGVVAIAKATLDH